MNIKFKDTSNMQSKAKTRPMAHVPFSHPVSPSPLSELSPLNTYQERPIKTNSSNFSFKGLSSYSGVEKAIKNFGDEFGETAKIAFREKINKAHSLENSGLTLKDDIISFSEKSFGKRFIDVALYPIVKMPVDLINATLTGLHKIPGLKNAKFLDNLMDTSLLKNRRTFLEKSSDVAGIQHYFELEKEGKAAFSEAHKRFNPLVSNYDSTAERTLTRLVTGAIPAFYLANDAYNLSIYMNDDKKLANKEKKRRFNQEVARIGITAGATYTVLSLFSKKSNASGAATVMLMSGLTFASEIIGRVLAGTPVLPVGVKGAKKYAKLQGKVGQSENDSTNKETNFSSNPKKAKKAENSKPPEKGNLTLKNFFKLFGILAVAGFGVEKLSAQKNVKKVLNDLNGKYKGLYSKKFTMSRDRFKVITDKLKNEGFDKIADKYTEMLKDQKGDFITLGKENNKLKYTVIHQVLTFPIRFAWDTLMAPYKTIVKPAVWAIADASNKVLKTNFTKTVDAAAEAAKKEKKKMDMLQNSLLFLEKNAANPDYKAKVSDSIVASLDNVTKSNHDNADLASVIKNTMSAITSAFLIADNYNLVMIDSGGENKDLAEQKAKERTIQRGVRLIYGAFLIKFLNGMFAKQYNASLLGAQAVNSLYAVSTETLERTSVGLPTTKSTREEVIAKEKKNLEAKGLRGGYYKFMAKLTGKKALSAKQKDVKNK